MKLPRINIFLLGDGTVGKTSSIIRYTSNKFNPTYLKTIIIDFKEKNIFHKNQEYKVIIWDTPGQERYHSISLPIASRIDVILIYYDVTDQTSFKNIDVWIKYVKEKNINPIIILVGNKIDLVDSREVSYQEGKDKASKYGFFFIETSCRTGENVSYLFEKGAKLAIEKEKNPKIDISLGDTIMLTPSKEYKKKGCC